MSLESVLIAAGTGVKAFGQIQAGVAASRFARAEAKYLDIQAKDEIQRGVLEERRLRLDIRRFLGTQRTAIGASGAELSGTSLELLGDTAALGEEDTLAIRSGAARRAFGKRTQATITRARGRFAKRKGVSDAFTTLLTGGAQAYGTI